MRNKNSYKVLQSYEDKTKENFGGSFNTCNSKTPFECNSKVSCRWNNSLNRCEKQTKENFGGSGSKFDNDKASCLYAKCKWTQKPGTSSQTSKEGKCSC